MNSDPGATPVPAAVLFLRLRGIADDLPSEQKSRRERLAATVAEALAPWDAARRVVLEGPEGMAIVGEVPPAAALAGARVAAEQGPDPRLGIALHHGPVRALRDALGGTHVEGDGIDTARALAGFEAPRPVVASQAFREALALRAPRQAEQLCPAGEQVDDRLRAHQLYVFDPEPVRQRALRRNVIGLAGLLVLFGAGLVGRDVREEFEAARRPATIVLDIKPAGEVLVDGELKGSAPPLVRVTVPPGMHTIEVRNGRFKPLHTEVSLQPGEEMQLKHVFTAPTPQRRARPQREPSLMDRLKSFL